MVEPAAPAVGAARTATNGKRHERALDQRAVIYCVEVDSFQDSNADGYRDLRGLIS